MRPGTVSHITIAPRGNALGFVRQIPESDRYLYTREQLQQQINVALAGCLAEELHFGNRSTGAQNDFMQASSLARTMVKCGLSRIGIVDEENLPDTVLDTEVRYILSEQEKATRELLQPFKDGIAEFAKSVVEEESISGDAFREWLERTQRHPEHVPELPAVVNDASALPFA
jgi:cell division protease FtsH